MGNYIERAIIDRVEPAPPIVDVGGDVGLPKYEISVKTGDVRGHGTANVYIILIDEDGHKSRNIELKWNLEVKDGFTGTYKVWDVPEVVGPIAKIELWTDSERNAWYIELIKVQMVSDQSIPFPCNRWTREDSQRLVLIKYDTVLPQFDERKDQRERELAENRIKYESTEIAPGCPKETKVCPADQQFSFSYKLDLGEDGADQIIEDVVLPSKKWKILSNTLNIYRGGTTIPRGCFNWNYDEDFGRQRVTGVNPTQIRLCTEIPSKIAVTSEMVEPFLESLTLDEAIKKKRIFIIDLEILHEMGVEMNGVLCAPIGLFYNTHEDDLIPIAIQLFQEPREDNPVFLPSDPHYLWMLVKLFFNNAEAAFHQACAHLEFTHLIGGLFAVSAHQHLSPSHPIFRLLAPHFLYLVAINSLAVKTLINTGGFIDKNMTMARKGLFELLKRGFKAYRLDVNGWLPTDLKNRGVDDPDVLHYYPYRDDGLLIHNAICHYVRDVITHFYDSESKLTDDYELQSWAQALVDPNGFALKGVAGDGKFENVEDLIKVVSSIIFICSAGHAAVNFGQYDQYGYPPNYPAILRGSPPKTKDEIQENDIMEQIPTKHTTLKILTITTILSSKATDSLGTFEVQYLYDPHSVKAAHRFREELVKISNIIQDRNQSRLHPYLHLDPANIPNAISI